jgi:uncharacterized protein (DUF697 family)
MTDSETAPESSEEARGAIHSASVAAAALGAVLSPIPLADEIALVPLYAWLTTRIGRAHGLETRQIPWRPLAKTAALGLAARAGLNLTVGFVPGVAALANAATAAALTELYGGFADRACRDPGAATAASLKELVEALRTRVARPA